MQSCWAVKRRRHYWLHTLASVCASVCMCPWVCKCLFKCVNVFLWVCVHVCVCMCWGITRISYLLSIRAECSGKMSHILRTERRGEKEEEERSEPPQIPILALLCETKWQTRALLTPGTSSVCGAGEAQRQRRSGPLCRRGRGSEREMKRGRGSGLLEGSLVASQTALIKSH